MFRHALALLLLAVAVWSTGSSQTAREAIEAVHAKGVALMKEGKIDEAFKVWNSDDAIFIKPNGMMIEGNDNIIAHYKRRQDTRPTKRYENTIEDVMADEDMAVEISTTKVTYEKEGSDVTKTFKHVIVWKKQDGTYKAIIDALYGQGRRPSAHHRVKRQTAREALEELNANFAAKIIAGKFREAVEETYAPNAKMIWGGKMFPDREAFIKATIAMEKKMKMVSYESTIEKLYEDTNMLVTIGKANMKQETEDGITREVSKRQLNVYRKEGGKYRMILGSFFKTKRDNRPRMKRDTGNIASDLNGLVDKMVEEYKAGNLDAMMSHYDENAKFIKGCGTMADGKDAIKEMFKKMVNTAKLVKEAKITIEKMVSDGTLIAAVAKAEATVEKDGQSKTYNKRRMIVAKKTGDELMILIDGMFHGDGTQATRRMKRETGQEIIERKHKELLKKMNEGKFAEAMTEMYNTDAYYVAPTGALYKGLEDIGKHFAEAGAGATDFATSVDSVIEDGEVMIELGLTKFITDKGKDNEMKHSMRHLAVWRKKDGKFLMEIDGLFAGDGTHKHPMRMTRRKREAESENKAETALMTLAEHMKKHYEERDIPKIMNHYDDNAKLITPKGGIVDGKEDIKKFLTKRMSKMPEGMSLGFQQDKLISDGTMAVAVGTISINKGDDSDPKKMRRLIVMKQTGDEMMIQVDALFAGDGSQTAAGSRRKRETAQEMISKAHAKFMELYKAGKPEEAMKVYKSDTIYIDVTGELLKGRDEVAKLFKKHESMMASLTTSVDTVIEDGNMAVEIGVAESGEHKMRYIAVWQKQEDGTHAVVLDSIFPGVGDEASGSGSGSSESNEVRKVRRRKRDAQSSFQTVVEHLIKHYKDADVDEIMDHYDDNAKLIQPTGGIVDGKENIKKHVTQKMTKMQGVKSIAFNKDKLFSDGTMAVAVGTVEVTKGAGEEEKTLKMRRVMVLKQTGEEMKIQIDAVFAGDGSQRAAGTRRRRETAQEMITNAHAKFMKLYKEGKPEEAMKVYTSNALYVEGTGGLLHGRDEIAKMYKKYESMMATLTTSVDTVIEDGDMAVEVGVADCGEQKMRYLAVWQKQADGEYAVVLDTFFPGVGDKSSGSSSESNETE